MSSATDTVHIFKLGAPAQPRNEDESSTIYSSSSQRGRSISPGGSDSQLDLTQSTSNASESVSTKGRKPNGSLLGMIRRTSQNVGTTFAASVGAYLPSAVSEMWEPARDFAWLKIPKAPPTAQGGVLASSAPIRSVVAMSSNSPQVMVVTNEGHFYVFGIDLEKGGEGILLKVNEVGNESEQLGASVMDD